MTEKRKFIRHDAIHLIDYLVLDQDNRSGRYSMGRTLDVSTNGLKLETNQPFPQGARLRVTVGLANELVDLSGTVTYSRARQGRFVSGVSFEGINNRSKKTFDLYVAAFNKRNATH